MAKVTVTLAAVYDDGKSAKNPGEQISIDDKLAQRLADLGMVEFPAKEGRPPKGKKPAGEDAPEGGGPDATNTDNFDPDHLGDE